VLVGLKRDKGGGGGGGGRDGEVGGRGGTEEEMGMLTVGDGDEAEAERGEELRDLQSQR